MTNRDRFSKIIASYGSDILLEILENIQDAVIMIDAEGEVTYVNRSYEVMFGILPDKIIGKNLNELEPESTVLRVAKTRQKVFGEVDTLKSLGDVQTIGIAFPVYTKDTNEFFGAIGIFGNEARLKLLTEELNRARELATYLQEQIYDEYLPKTFQEIICHSDNMKRILNLAAKVAKTESTVLIRGESGVGKEILAKAIHNTSDRSEHPYIKVNCASIPESLLESELFGYEDGAFTGARKGGKLGKFELANEGTIFLDEIGDMAFEMQAKLLRVLQEKELERIGGSKPIPLNIRIIAATNRNLEKMIKEEQFRSDLYYRLNVMPLNIPPLRERRADILPLARNYLKQLNEKMKIDEKVTISSDTIRIFHTYDWPGNIRELQNSLEHANILRSHLCIEPKFLPKHLKVINGSQGSYHMECTGKDLNLKRAVSLLEKELIKEALHQCSGNKSKAIEELGISRRSFYEKLDRYNI